MIYIIGISVEGKTSLSQKVLRIIENANLLVGGKRHLSCFPEFKGKKVVIGSKLDEIVKRVQGFKGSKVQGSAVVLATGDPDFFGIADFLIKKLGRDKIEIIPNVSTMQSAFAKIKENWNDARFLSLHGRKRVQGFKGSGVQGNDIFDEITKYDKVGIFTDPENTPSKIAQALLNKGIKDYTVYVCEDLGTEKEKITQGTLSKIIKKEFSSLNVMVLIRQTKTYNLQIADCNYPFGIPDPAFSHSKGMITKEEIRVISLSKLRLKEDSILWDIGAGSGSLSIEASLIAKIGMVFAIEKDRQRIGHIERNKKRFGVANLEIIHAAAPLGLKNLPLPDAVFVGGGGRDIGEILKVSSKKLIKNGRLVVNAITLETVSIAYEFFKKHKWKTEIVSVNIAKTKNFSHLNLFHAFNPVFIIVGEKP